MSLRDDLIAAKALIDTPEKMVSMDPFMAILMVEPLRARMAVIFALKAHLPTGEHQIHQYQRRASHADIMQLFDRAIVSAQHEGHGETGESANG